MSGSKRLAKRSIVGTKVSALWHQDGRYYPGVIRALAAEATPATSALYTIRFDDGFESSVTSKDIVGPGFQTGASGRLKHGQKVYVTQNGREVSGLVAHHDRRTDEVILIVKQGHGEEMTIHRKVEEVRLMESRKSARLQDQATDYSKLADLQLGEPKRRAVSHNIDVPSVATKASHTRYRYSSGETESSESGGNVDDVEVMDENIAAMVLTSLSVSPTPSPHSSWSPSTGRDGQQEHSYVSSSVASSGFFSGHSERGEPSPPSPSRLSDFDCNSHSPHSLPAESALSTDLKQGGVRFRCTWPGCRQMFEVLNDVERHIRRGHLDRDSDIELSDGEEEFYYEEVSDEVMDSVTQSFAGMLTSSPPAGMSRSADSISTFDHDYQKKQRDPFPASSSLPSGESTDRSGAAISLPITIPEDQIKRSLSWQTTSPGSAVLVSPPQRFNKPTPQERLQQHQAQSPKSHMLHASPLKSNGPHRKPRSDVRKCRKVYGMDKKELWCTQCKWKKACTRFLD